MFCIEFINITFKQGTLRLNEMYLQYLDNVVYITMENKVMHRNIFLRHSRDPTELEL